MVKVGEAVGGVDAVVLIVDELFGFAVGGGEPHEELRIGLVGGGVYIEVSYELVGDDEEGILLGGVEGDVFWVGA